MNEVQLLYVTNEVSRKKGLVQQDLSFFILVKNIHFTKHIDVIWSGEDGQWRTLPARFHSATQGNKEYWLVSASFKPAPQAALPGGIQFALRYRADGHEFWDNNHGLNYRSLANSGIHATDHHPLLNIGFQQELEDGRKLVPITVAVSQSLRAQKVTVHWTMDDWKQTNITRCYQKRSRSQNRDGNPIEDRDQVWKGLLNIGNAFRLQYSICCESDDQVLWDNNFDQNYSARRKSLKVLILNLHCLQEENQDAKFSRIARAIDELDVDIACLQEVAEPWNAGRGNPELNSAKIINDRLASPYHLYTDWSHLGFDQYREGVAILSRHPLLKRHSKYVSKTEDPYNIHARRVVMTQINVPSIGLINLFSSHLSCWNDGFAEQFKNLRQWATAKQGEPVKAIMLCGDFNIKAGSKGYELVVSSDEYQDQFLAARSPEVFAKIFGTPSPGWQKYLNDDHRIDYIFMNKSSSLRVTSARELFTEQDYGRVSDHFGYLMTFEPR